MALPLELLPERVSSAETTRRLTATRPTVHIIVAQCHWQLFALCSRH